MNSLFGLEGKSVLVIGGGFGMGEATVGLLASLGANIAVLDLDPDRAERVANEARVAGVNAVSLCADVNDEAALVAAIGQAERDLAPLDAMASVVGMAAWSTLLDMTLETWDTDHRRNLRYFFIAAREVARRMVERGAPGSIVAVSSIDGIRSTPNHASYGAAKAGLLNLVKTMAAEWAQYGLRINCVAPGGIVTPRVPLTDPERERQAMAMLPMQRRGTTDDIAKAIAYFLSDMSPYVTGQTLAVDGGYTAVGVFQNRATLPSGGTYGDRAPKQ